MEEREHKKRPPFGDLLRFTTRVDERLLTSAWGFLTGFVNHETAPADLFVVKSVDSVESAALVRHFHEAETTRASGFTVCDEASGDYRAILFESTGELIFIDVIREISNVRFILMILQ